MDIQQYMKNRISLAEPVHQVGDRFIDFNGREMIISRIDKIHDEVIYGVSEIKGSQ